MTQAKAMQSAPRDSLIAAGAKLFAQKGFEGASVRQICKEAGTGINMIHHYFGDKQGLLDAILERLNEGVFATPLRLLQSPAKSREDFESRMQLVFETTLEAYIAHRDLALVALREQPELETLDSFQQRFVAFLDEGKAAGFVRPELDTAMISGAMLDRLVNYVAFAPWISRNLDVDLLNDKDYIARWCQANLDLFLRGMVRE